MSTLELYNIISYKHRPMNYNHDEGFEMDPGARVTVTESGLDRSRPVGPEAWHGGTIKGLRKILTIPNKCAYGINILTRFFNINN